MNIRISLPVLILIALCAAAPSTASAQRADPPAGGTPNSCIERNAGDWNACNVGNAGRGDLPYL
jgi:hypothetical protein